MPVNIDREFARELAYLKVGGELDGYTVIDNSRIGERRWVSEHQLVIKAPDGALYRDFYELGLTERQEERPFEETEPDFRPVRQVPVTVFEYEDI